MAKPVQIVSEDQLDAELKALFDVLKSKNPDLESPDGWPSQLPKPIDQMVGPEDDQQYYSTTFMINDQKHAAFLVLDDEGRYNRFQLFTKDQLDTLYKQEVQEGIIDKINRDINPITGMVPENNGMIEENPDGTMWRHGPLDDPAVVDLRDHGLEFGRAIGVAEQSLPAFAVDAKIIEQSDMISFSKILPEAPSGASLSLSEAQQPQNIPSKEAPISAPESRPTPFDIMDEEMPDIEGDFDQLGQGEDAPAQGLVDLSPLLPAFAIDADPAQQLQAAHDAAVTALDHMKWSHIDHEPDHVKLSVDQIGEVIEDYETDYPGFADVLRQAHASMDAGRSPGEVWGRAVESLGQAHQQLSKGVAANIDAPESPVGPLAKFSDVPVLKDNHTFTSVALDGEVDANHILWKSADGAYMLYDEKDFFDILNDLNGQDFERGQDYVDYMQRVGNSMNALAQVNGGEAKADFRLAEDGSALQGGDDPRVQAAFLRHRDFDGDAAIAQDIEQSLQAQDAQQPGAGAPNMEGATPGAPAMAPEPVPSS